MNSHSVLWTLDDLLADWVGEPLPPIPVLGLSMDSRLVAEGDLYLAIPGATTHGIHFASQAVSAGAVAVAVALEDANDYQDQIQSLKECNIPVALVKQLKTNANNIASLFYANPDKAMTLIAVTGTDGKTSVCRFIAQAFNNLNRKCGYIGTLGWGFDQNLLATDLTTPDSVALRRMLASMRDEGAEYIALEASSHGLAEGRLHGLDIDIAVLTNLGRDHLDYHKTIDAYKAAKATLFNWSSLTTRVLNGEDKFGNELLKRYPASQTIAYYTVDDPACKSTNRYSSDHVDNGVVATKICTDVNGLSFLLSDTLDDHNAMDGESSVAQLKEQNEVELAERSQGYWVRSGLLGRFNVENLLACYCSLRACGVAANDASHAVSTVIPIAGRMEHISAPHHPSVVVDYCHTPQALELAINALRVHCLGELWVVFGCGGDRDKGKRKYMAVASESADHVIVTDDNPRHEASQAIIDDILVGFRSPEDVVVIPDRVAAIHFAVVHAKENDWVLVAGKGHETYQLVGDTRFTLSDREEVRAALGVAS